MAENRPQEDEGTHVFYAKQLRGGKLPIDFNVSSDIYNYSLKKTPCLTPKTTRQPNVQPVSANISMGKALQIFDMVDRPENAYTQSTYAQSGTYAEAPKNEPGKRIPKAGAFAEAGVGRARAEFSVFEAEARGPNAMAGAEANMFGASAMARAEVGSVSANAGPIGVKLGLSFDTGVSVGVDGVEVKFLGCGIKIGPRTSLSLFGTEVSCSIL